MAKLIALLLLVTAVAADVKDCTNYGPKHNLCRLAPADCSANQGGPCKAISGDEAALIVKLHNEVRQKVASGQETRGSPGPQPAATNLKEMKWSPELARIAQRWADQLPTGHICDADLIDGKYIQQCVQTKTYDQIGENLYSAGKWNLIKAADWKAAVADWASEAANVNSKDFSNGNPGTMIGHYTQLVWAKTNEVGCGVYTNNKKGCSTFPAPFKCITYICNYGPAGNMAGEKPYSTTEQCSNYSKTYPKLCA